MNKKIIYLDNAATTPVDPEVVDAMLPYFTEKYGNPSSLYSIAREAKADLEKARKDIAEYLGADNASEIIFTSGGTESNNLAIKGIAMANEKRGKHIITSPIEHHAVLHTIDFLKPLGYEVSYVPVDKYGVVILDELKKLIRKDTVLVSVMTANNEIGTIQPIKEISEILKENNIYFHTDAVQAIGSIDTNIKNTGVDALSLSAHKFYGPKGVGALYIKKGISLKPQNNGGGQESRRRSGTENTAGIIGMAKAMELAFSQSHQEKLKIIAEMRNNLIKGIMYSIPKTHLSGHPEKRLPNNASFVFEYVEGESILLNLDFFGICASSGSACTSNSLEPSHVLKACGIPIEIAHGSIRFTLGNYTTKEDIDFVIKEFPLIIDKLRKMSPLYKS